jgi:hypothetical protein
MSVRAELATVVSAYYPIPSKYPPDQYLEWIRTFWPQMRCPLVMFTEPDLVGMLTEILGAREGAGGTRVIGLPFSQLTAFTALDPAVWFRAWSEDPEKGVHSPQLYALWWEKKEFVRRVIEMNPFGSTKFIWCDAGIGRYPGWTSTLAGRFPFADRVPQEKMLLLEIRPFEQADFSTVDAWGVRGGDFTRRNSVGGGILAADIEGWRKWSAAVDSVFMKFLVSGRFVGKDQNIYASVALEFPDRVLSVSAGGGFDEIQKWFYLLFYLAYVEVA